jgi:hypothetical protein
MAWIPKARVRAMCRTSPNRKHTHHHLRSGGGNFHDRRGVEKMKIIGHPERFAFEIGEYRDSRQLRHVDIWAGGVRLCIDDNTVYLSQFIDSLSDEIRRSYRISDFAKYLRGLSPIEMAVFVSSTREENSPNYGMENDSIYHHYMFLNLGPTTDNLVAFLFRDTQTSYFVYSFWRETLKTGDIETYQVVELEFDEIISVARDAMNTLLDT